MRTLVAEDVERDQLRMIGGPCHGRVGSVGREQVGFVQPREVSEGRVLCDLYWQKRSHVNGRWWRWLSFVGTFGRRNGD